MLWVIGVFGGAYKTIAQTRLADTDGATHRVNAGHTHHTHGE
jgi:hypothetical protein